MDEPRDSEDDWLEDDWPDDVDDDVDDDEAAVVPCPSCGAAIYEDAVSCPVCGEYVVHSTSSVWESRPWWWVVLGAVGIVAVIAALTAL